MPAPQFKGNTTRFDPYKTYRVRMKLDGNYVAGFSKVGGLERTTEVSKHRMGGDPSVVRVTPGKPTYERIALEQGVTCEVSFAQWASAGLDVSAGDFRKDVVIELYNEAGQKVMAYNVHRCWASEFRTRPDLGHGADIAILSLMLEHEGISFANQLI